MWKYIWSVGILLLACNAGSAQKSDPDDGYWGPRDTFHQRWPVQPLKTYPRLGGEGYNMGNSAPPETTGHAETSRPKNSPDPNPVPGEDPRPIQR